MYTECPHCHAIFRVTQEILQAAAGKVRCGECATVFQAVKPQKEVTRNTSPESRVLPSETVKSEEKPPVPAKKSLHVDRRGAPQDNPVTATASFHRDAHEDEVSDPSPKETEAPSTEEFKPKYLPIPTPPQQTVFKSRSRSLFIPLLIILLILLLAQVLTANRKALGSKPIVGPLVTAICKVSGCKVPQRKDLEAIDLLNHGVFSHPTVPGALMIKAMIQNKADFEQPYPVIELGFSDIRGKAVAMRRFGPAEYLDLRKEHPEKMPVGTNIPIRVEVIDPGKAALAFEFDFL